MTKQLKTKIELLVVIDETLKGFQNIVIGVIE